MIRLYVDEQGTDTLKNIDDDKHRYLSLTGLAIDTAHVRDYLLPNINRLKADLFDEDPECPVILHRKDILGGKGPFKQIRSDMKFRDEFDRRILDIFETTNYVVITALIDKQWMIDQSHWERRHPYHYLMEIIVEKFVQYLESRGKDVGDIMPESRQDKDKLLQREFDRLRIEGTDYVSAERIIDALRGKELKFRKKSDNVAGLQLCDLLAHPSHIYARSQMGHDVNLGKFAKLVCNVLIKSKYDRSAYGRIKGYGYKSLP